MENQDIKINDKRIHFSKKIKRKILLELACGANAETVLKKYINSDLEDITTDEKYVAKLIHKWRAELYKDTKILHLLHYEPDFKMIQEEIESMGEDEDSDFNLDEAINDLKSCFVKLI